MNKLDQMWPEFEPGLHKYEQDALATTANLALKNMIGIYG